MIIDVSFYQEFHHAESVIDDYDELMSFMRKFDEKYYKNHGIKVQAHTVVPSCEANDKDLLETIWLPISIHFKAHILRAKESIQHRVAHYTEAFCIMCNCKELRHFFYDELAEAKQYYKKYYRAGTYERAYGKKKADLIKRRISNAMKGLPYDVIKERNVKISQYASSRPESHNNAISVAKKKPIIHVNSGILYDCVDDAAKATGISVSSIRRCCQGKVQYISGNEFDYLCDE